MGLAGHVDHGKTTLVEALTGTRLDRTPEAGRRGMTVDLAFARLQLDGGSVADLVDVPGHEALVHTMVRGAAAIGCGLLVVAADDGVMPQTREHLTVLGFLEVPRLVVGLTKVGMTEPDLVDLAEMEVRELAAASRWPDAPVIRVDSLTGEGLEGLRAALAAAASDPQSVEVGVAGELRLPIDRAFTLAGHGTVVTGTLLGDRIVVGARLVLEPGGRRVRVRGMQRHGRALREAMPGDRVALNLADTPVDAVPRGAVIGRAGELAATHRLDVRLRLSATASRPLRDGDRVRVHVLAARGLARVRVLEGSAVAPGASALAHLKLEQPMVALAGDRFVIRTLSPSWTVGGGTVLRAQTRKVRPAQAAERVAELHLLERAAPAEAVLAVLERAAEMMCPSELARRTALPIGAVIESLDRLAQAGSVRRVGEGFVSASAWIEGRRRVVEALEGLHRADPSAAGHPIQTVRHGSGLAEPLAAAALDDLAEAGSIEIRGASCALAGWTARLDAKSEAVASEVLVLVRAGGRKPTRKQELEERLFRVQVQTLRRVVNHLVESGELARLRGTGEGSGALMDPESLAEARALALALLGERPSGVSLPELRDALGMGRHPTQWLAEHLDAEGLTRREGHLRYARRSPPGRGNEDEDPSSERSTRHGERYAQR